MSAIKEFVDGWRARGSEKSDAHLFWIEFLTALGLEEPAKKIIFEHPIDIDGHKYFIDALIPSTKVLIEHKSRGIDLDKPARQSDGAFLTPFQQACRYASELPYSLLPRWIVTCNFDELRIYDLNRLSKWSELTLYEERSSVEPMSIKLEQLSREAERLNFLIDPEDENVYPEIKISKRAGDLVGNLYRAFKKNLSSDVVSNSRGDDKSSTPIKKNLSRLPVQSFSSDDDNSSVPLEKNLSCSPASSFSSDGVSYSRGGDVESADSGDTSPSSLTPSSIAPLSKAARVKSGVEDKRAAPFDPYSALNKLCVRLVFCLYAEDDHIFERDQFTDYLRAATDRRQALIELFKVLDTPNDLRAETLSSELAAFPYVNGDLFSDADDVPDFPRDAAHYILVKLDPDGNGSWSGINPTIFGALFESTLNPNTRRSGGMHYTSLENIHCVIDPLFLDGLHDEFKTVRRKKKNKRRALEEFQRKISELKFLDPACGSGNFLTETYLSLRRLENDVLRELCSMGVPCSIRVSINNFFGIEVNDFAVAVARTAMWIAEHQMMQETELFLSASGDEFLPLTRAAHIVEGNALRLDWNEIVPRVDYIIGNPPFSGARMMTAANKADLQRVFEGWKGAGNLDFVSAWFKRAADFMIDTRTRAAFVATNSICQGETVSILWGKLLELVHIDFAHRPFRWSSESENIAAVHCVIVGFSHAPSKNPKIIFDGKQKIIAHNINGYLLDAPNYYVTRRVNPICDVPPMSMGNQPIDGGYYLFTSDEYEDFIRREPRAQKYFRRWYGAEELLNGKIRRCLWLGDASEEELLSMPCVVERADAVRRYRLASKSAPTRKLAVTPTRFNFENMPTTEYLVIPEVSSERRRYIPMGFLTPDVLCSNQLFLIPGGGLYEFGVLMSSVHMFWLRVIAGRLESRYRYSATIVYNNFVWASATEAQRLSIETSARKILEVRSKYPDWTLATMYNESTMPEELRRAHEENDRRVMELYGFDGSMSELDIVSRLMLMYEARIKKF